jgi:metallo-beta-lactamase class B
VVESGGKTDFHYAGDPSTYYPPTKVDRVLHDGDDVKLGDAVLTARLTPGHTKGCTTWTMKVTEDGRSRDVVIIGGTAVNPGFRLINNAPYPQIAEDYAKTFEVLKSLNCDYCLGAHGAYFNMEAKYDRLMKGDKTAFIGSNEYKKYVAEAEEAYLGELAKQRGAK